MTLKGVKAPSSNWLRLKKSLPKKTSRTSLSSKQSLTAALTRKRKRSDSLSTDGGSVLSKERAPFPRGDSTSSKAGPSTEVHVSNTHLEATERGHDTKESLKQMILGQMNYTDSQRQCVHFLHHAIELYRLTNQERPGRYLALDCEMVGVGINGSESSLARISLVNYHGAVILDEFVRQRERVVDYRTFVSGVRESDMVKGSWDVPLQRRGNTYKSDLLAKPFKGVQKMVADLLEDRVLVGHAVFNDLKALLLSHPHTMTRDTQLCAGKQRLLKTKYPALRKLVQHEFGIDIQAGEHSSVTDARATMALYRLHRKAWDKDWRPPVAKTTEPKKLKREHESVDNDTTDDSANGHKPRPSKKGKQKDVESSTSSGGRKGVSSGLSTVVKRATTKGIERIVNSHRATARTNEKLASALKSKDKWWQTLGGNANSIGSKGSVSLSRR